MIPSKQWVAKCCHPDIDGGPLTIGEGDNWGKCWFITIRKLQSISREERYVVDGDGIKEDVRVRFDNVVHLQTRRWGGENGNKGHIPSISAKNTNGD